MTTQGGQPHLPHPLASRPDQLPTVPPPRLFTRQYDERLGLAYPVRQFISIAGGAIAGLTMGVSLGAKTSALRYRAENAHRLPTSHKGWYLYHKSKNYQAMWGGLKEGGRMGVKIGFWAGLFVSIEDTVDNWRNDTKDALSTVIAGLACAGAFSAWNRFPLATAARTVKMSLAASLAFGLGQDMLGVLRGRDVSYVSFVKKRIIGQGQQNAA